jgi:TPR repeat protein
VAKLFGQACDSGTAVACFNLGLLHESGSGTVHDGRRAQVLFKKACEGGYQQACGRVLH